MNKVFLTGRLTKDPEITTTSNGKQVCRFGLAVKRRFANDNGEHDADFINCVVWGKQAENCNKYLKKGDKCGIVGAIQTRTYESNGKKQYATDVVAEEVEFLTIAIKKSEPKAEQPQFEQVAVDDDNLPF